MGDATYANSMLTRIEEDYERRNSTEPSKEKERDTTIDLSASPLLGVDLIEFYAKDNSRKHHTDAFEIVYDVPPVPVFRRGITFLAGIRFNRPYDKEKDHVSLIFRFGPEPIFANGTEVIIPLEEKPSFRPRQWDAKIFMCNGNIINIEVQIPPDTMVGEWICTVRTTNTDHPTEKRSSSLKQILYILFNPWCPDDVTYMKDSELLEEYVLNETGKVWMGTYSHPIGRPWIFGQFNEVVLPIVIVLLNRSKLPHANRGNPVLVARAISAVMNSADDEGLLVGNWSEDYSEGVHPNDWTGSSGIYEKFLLNKGKSVKYGQCWVFSAVSVTAFRALGIPARSVTNYVSGHDTDANLTIDKYMKSDGEEIVGGPNNSCYDSIWNFHVWTDVWMTRQDLPVGYGGWQTIDATPQERSEGLMQCGPASIEAVKNGQIGFRYDTAFVFSEVNADVMYFMEDPSCPYGFKKISSRENHVGKVILTKKPNVMDHTSNSDMQDLTLDYKYPEGCVAERNVVKQALIMAGASPVVINPEPVNDVTFELGLGENVTFGQEFTVTVKLENTSAETRTVDIHLVVDSVYYNGVIANQVKNEDRNYSMNSKTSESMEMTITVAEYMQKAADHSLFKLRALANVKETGHTWSGEEVVPLKKPPLNIEINGIPRVQEECEAIFRFKNPLDVLLTDCKFLVEGTGLQKPATLPFRNVEPNENVEFVKKFTPKKSGEKTYVASFKSTQLSGVTGSITLKVEE